MRNFDPPPDEPSLVETQPEYEPRGPRHLSDSQAKALKELSNLFSLRGNLQTYGGFVPRAKPLLVGVSGVGKTSLVYRLADIFFNVTSEGKEGLLCLNAGS